MDNYNNYPQQQNTYQQYNPSQPQQPTGYSPQGVNQPYPPVPPKKKNTALIIVIIIVAVIALAGATVAGVLIYKHHTAPSSVGNFSLAEFERVFDAAEIEFVDADGKIPDDKINEVLETDAKVLEELESDKIAAISINYDDESLDCNLEGGGRYRHFPRGNSYVEDEDGNIVEEESDSDNSDNSGKTESAQTDYTAFENALKDHAYSFVGAKMKCRKVGDKVYFCDSDIDPTKVLCFNTKTSEVETVAKIKSHSELGFGEMTMTLVRFGEKGFFIIYNDRNEDFKITASKVEGYEYETMKDISKNANRYVHDYDGELLYSASEYGDGPEMTMESWGATGTVYNSNICFTASNDMPEYDNEDYMIKDAFFVSGELLAIIGDIYNEENVLISANGSSSKKIANIAGGYCIMDDKVYYSKGDGSVYSYDPSASGEKNSYVCTLQGCNTIYAVFDEYIYYAVWSEDAKATIYRKDVVSGDETEICTDYFPMDAV